VVNNEPGAKGIGGAPVVLKAIQHGATALDAYSVPTDKHPNGFLPDFYSHFGFEKLGSIPFNERYITHDENGNKKPLGELHLADIKHEWAKSGWDEKRHSMPSIAIMKWRGKDEDRSNAVRRFVTQGGRGFGSGNNPTNVRSPAGLIRPSTGAGAGVPQGGRGISDTSGDSGPVGADNAPRIADRFTRTLSEVKNLAPSDVQHFGLNPEDIERAKAQGLKRGGAVSPVHVKHVHFGHPYFHAGHFGGGGSVDDGQNGITAYHGSPHDFDQFSLGSVGAGTGDQAYGHGLYFAQAEPTAMAYRDMLAGRNAEVIDHVIKHAPEMQDIRPDVMSDIRRWSNAVQFDPITAAKHAQNANRDLRAFDSARVANVIASHRNAAKGHMYEVHINAHPDHFLDWEKPLSEQSGHIQTALQKIYGDQLPSKMTGGDLHDKMNYDLGGANWPLHANYEERKKFVAEANKRVAAKLHEHGIKGIKYPDITQKSHDEEPTHNYVVFNDKDVHVKRKYAHGGEVDEGHRVHFPSLSAVYD
jgi:hypothetical protein